MTIKELPFAHNIGIEKKEHLTLSPAKRLNNHLNTIHAGAQFTLAETQSGLFLQDIFPELVSKVIPLLRDAKIKYKKPAEYEIFASASINEEDKERFLKLFNKKGRASILVKVQISDIHETLCAEGEFSWFIQGC